jgi:asparagine synthase (glutamine-hydrolysing)
MELTAFVDPAGKLPTPSAFDEDYEVATSNSAGILTRSGHHELYAGGLAESEGCVVGWRGDLKNKQALRSKFGGPNETGQFLLHLFRSEGISALEQLPGRVSIIYYEPRTGRLIAARDKMGLTPFMFYRTEGVFLGSTHVSPLRKHLSVTERPNRHRLAVYLLQASVADRSDFITPFERVLPGESAVVFPDGEVKFRQYYSRRTTRTVNWQGFETTARNLRGDLQEAVINCMEEPIVYEMSGGIDSTAFVGMHCKLAKARETTVQELPKTASLITQSPKFPNENDLIGQMVQNLPLDNLEFDLGEGVELFNASVLENEAGYGPQWYPAAGYSIQFRKKIVEYYGRRIIVAGQGGDHLFRGRWQTLFFDFLKKGKFREALDVLSRNPGTAGGLSWGGRRVAARILPSMIKSQLKRFREIDKPWLHPERWVQADCNEPRSVGLNERLDVGLPHELTWSWENFAREFVRKNRLSRVKYVLPYFEPSFAELYSQLPISFRLREGTHKAILREACRGVLPKKILQAPKRLWLGHLFDAALSQNRQKIESLFENSRLSSLGLINVSSFLSDFDSFLKQYDYSSGALGMTRLWRTISAEKWLKKTFP